MYGICTYIYHENLPNVGKYTSPMDPMGLNHVHTPGSLTAKAPESHDGTGRRLFSFPFGSQNFFRGELLNFQGGRQTNTQTYMAEISLTGFGKGTISTD